MRGKKGFQLTATFLVILIITITIFIGSIAFTRRFFTSAEQMRATIDRQTEAEIESLLYQEGSVIALPILKKKIPRGQQTTFGVGVKNMLEKTENFYIFVKFSKGFDPNEEVIPGTDSNYIDSKWILYHQGPYTIENNKLEMIPIMTLADLKISEGENTPKGVYSFNVCVIAGPPPSGFDCARPPRPLPPAVYGGKVYKLYMEVV